MGERPSSLQFAGVIVALVGVVLASRELRGGQTVAAAGVGLAVFAALGFGLFFVAIDQAADRDLLWALLIGRLASTTLLAVAALVRRPSFALSRNDVGTLVAIGVLDVSANGLFAASASVGLVSLASVLSSLYPVVTIVLARVLLGERLLGFQRVGAGVALAGVALISAG